jgi:hypothetical protein
VQYLDEKLLHEKLNDYRRQADRERLLPRGRTRKAIARALHRTAEALDAGPRDNAGAEFDYLQPAVATDGMRFRHD